MTQAADFVARTGNAGSTGLNRELIRGDIVARYGGWQHYIAFKIGVVLTTLFLFFTTTTLVSFTLRVTQERMLKFTFLLQVGQCLFLYIFLTFIICDVYFSSIF